MNQDGKKRDNGVTEQSALAGQHTTNPLHHMQTRVDACVNLCRRSWLFVCPLGVTTKHRCAHPLIRTPAQTSHIMDHAPVQNAPREASFLYSAWMASAVPSGCAGSCARLAASCLMRALQASTNWVIWASVTFSLLAEQHRMERKANARGWADVRFRSQGVFRVLPVPG